MACEGEELSGLPLLLGCPGAGEKILVVGAIGGLGAGGYALRNWSDIKSCVVGIVKEPLIGVVDGGGKTDPLSGTSVFQSDLLVGLGSKNSGRIQIVIDNVLYSNFGLNASFTFDNTTGIINISPNVWVATSGLYIDLNQ